MKRDWILCKVLVSTVSVKLPLAFGRFSALDVEVTNMKLESMKLDPWQSAILLALVAACSTWQKDNLASCKRAENVTLLHRFLLATACASISLVGHCRSVLRPCGATSMVG